MRSIFEGMLSDNSEFIGTCAITEESHEELARFFDEMTESKREYDAMTPIERTLYITDNKYDTILVSNHKVRYILEEEYGKLNIIVNNIVSKYVVMMNMGELRPII